MTPSPLHKSARWKTKCWCRSCSKLSRKSSQNNQLIKGATGTSRVAQWLRIHLSMQGTQVPSLVWEDLTSRGATKPVHHNYWACALEPVGHNYWACVPQLLKPTCLEPCSATREATAMRNPCTTMKSSPRSPQLEKACAQQWRPNAAKNKKI